MALPPPSAAAELVLLGAPRVTEIAAKGGKKRGKQPQTAKEALQLRAQRKTGKKPGRKPRDGRREVVEEHASSDARSPSDPPAALPKRTRPKSVRSAAREPEAPVAAKPPGLWQRIKGLFSAGR